MIEYFIENPKLISIRFEHDPEVTRLVKKIPERIFHSSNKQYQIWMIPLSPATVGPLFKFEEETQSFIPAHITKALVETRQFVRNNFIGSSAIAPNYNDLERISSLFRDRLYPYQQAGALYCLQNRTVIIGDEMGLGKTIEILATIESANSYPALIICPASLKINWKRECDKWVPERKVCILGLDKEDDATQILIANYEALEKNKWLSLVPWSCVVADEAHYLKNSKAERTKNVKEISRNAERVILATGTPVVNAPFDLVSLLEITRKLQVFGGFWGFVNEYCDPQKTRFGYDFTGSTNLDELNVKMRECGYLRREKNEVLPELPEKIRQDLYIEIDNRTEYEYAKHDLIKYLRENRGDEKAQRAERAKILVGINTLRQIAIEGKIKKIFDWIIDFKETGKSIVVFGWHEEVLMAIADKFDCYVLSGSTSLDDRQKMIDSFQCGETKIIAINIKAGGVGLTLTAATYELFVEYAWNDATMKQAEDRAHRIGQKSALNIYRAIGVNTIDELFIRMIEEKKGVSEDAISNTDGIDFLIQELLKEE